MTEVAVSSTSSTKKRRLSVALGVLAVVGVGAFVGNIAGDIAHRAPRGGGLRVAVLPGGGPLGASPLDVTGLALRDAIARDLAFDDDKGKAAVTVIPLEVVESKRKAMVRGGIQEAELWDAAEVLDADLIVTLRKEPSHFVVTAGNRELGRVSTSAPFEVAVAEALAVARSAEEIAKYSASRPARAPTTNLEAYTAFLDGERLLRVEGRPRDAAERYREASKLDLLFVEASVGLAYAVFFLDEPSGAEFADARAYVKVALSDESRLSKSALLTALALRAWIEHDDAPEQTRDALREPLMAACRAMTVRLSEEPFGHPMLGRAYARVYGGPSEALRHLESARRLMPEYFPTTVELVVTWLKLKDRRHAESAVRGFLYTTPGHAEAKRLLEGLAVPLPGSTPLPLPSEREAPLGP